MKILIIIIIIYLIVQYNYLKIEGVLYVLFLLTIIYSIHNLIPLLYPPLSTEATLRKFLAAKFATYPILKLIRLTGFSLMLGVSYSVFLMFAVLSFPFILRAEIRYIRRKLSQYYIGKKEVIDPLIMTSMIHFLWLSFIITFIFINNIVSIGWILYLLYNLLMTLVPMLYKTLK